MAHVQNANYKASKVTVYHHEMVSAGCDNWKTNLFQHQAWFDLSETKAAWSELLNTLSQFKLHTCLAFILFCSNCLCVYLFALEYLCNFSH